jgi:hypothetical protein
MLTMHQTAGYVTTLSELRLIGEWIFHWKGCRRKWMWSNWMYYPGISMEELRKPRKTQVSRFCALDPNQAPPEYNSEVLPLEPACIIWYCLCKNISTEVKWLTSCFLKVGQIVEVAGGYSDGHNMSITFLRVAGSGRAVHALLRVYWPITVAALSKAFTVFGRSNAGIVGSNPTQSMDVCIVCVYSVFVLFCV